DVGTVVETPEFYLYLTPRETLKYIGEIIGLNSETIKNDTEVILERVKMTEWADKRLGTFSKGMRQRIALGQALLNDPRVIILDEPTSGLDPRGMAEIREVLKNLRNHSNNLTVMMSSHILHEVSDLCDRIALINHGTLLIHDDIGVFNGTTGARRVSIKLTDAPTADIIDKISRIDNVESAERLGNDIEAYVNDGSPSDKAKFFNDLGSIGVGVYGVYEEDSLETTYLNLIKESR
ncbi:MAG: ABC transporter ATP-binding protein, partial [Candidatus Methanoplasma sp.]|nr:ABC transporter ATP-binding protein [Candidatus Methanoplasma sp.]